MLEFENGVTCTGGLFSRFKYMCACLGDKIQVTPPHGATWKQVMLASNVTGTGVAVTMCTVSILADGT